MNEVIKNFLYTERETDRQTDRQTDRERERENRTESLLPMNNRNVPYDCIKDTSKITHNT